MNKNLFKKYCTLCVFAVAAIAAVTSIVLIANNIIKSSSDPGPLDENVRFDEDKMLFYAWVDGWPRYIEPNDDTEMRRTLREWGNWNCFLGIYISKEFSDENGNLTNMDERFSEPAYDSYISTNWVWYENHRDSNITDPIDMALLYYFEELLPTVSRHSHSSYYYEASKEAMETLGMEYLTELWKRVCEDPGLRMTKIVAIANMLNISTELVGISMGDNLGSISGRQWWLNKFAGMQHELRNPDIQFVDYPQYGALAIPFLLNKYQKGESTNTSVLIQVIDAIQQTDYYRLHQTVIDFASFENFDKAIDEWVEANEAYINAITELLYSDYEWFEP